MKSFKNLCIAALIVGLFASCLPDQESPQEIFQKDLVKIDEYVENTDFQYVDKLEVEGSGIVILYHTQSFSGVAPEAGDTLRVDYAGSLLNGTVFDTSVEAIARDNRLYNSQRVYEPFEIKYLYDGMIPGFDIGLSKMEMGDSARVVIPSYYGYGNRQQGDRIPANSVLVFDLAMREVKKDTDTNAE
ncbi:hypothetical protein GCM10028791_03070 [Echinicola sediminis]